MKLTAHLNPVPRIRLSGAILLLPIYFNGVDRGIFTARTSPRNFMVAAAATDDDDDDDNSGDGGNGRGGGDDKFQTA